jgi:hypothetical protein
MGFDSGSVSFRRFIVSGKQPGQIDQDLLDRLAAHAFQERTIGRPDEIEYGWCGGRHVLDAQFTFEHNVFSEALFFALRIDTNKIPAELKRAYVQLEEEAAAAQNPSGFASKAQKKAARESAQRKIDDELREGRHRKTKLVPVLWHLPSSTVFSPAGSTAAEKLMEIFERTFDLQLQPLTAGTLAYRMMEERGQTRDYEDLRPTVFAPAPHGDDTLPEYPWVLKGPQPKDFLGNEFLLWLWHEADAGEGSIEIGETNSVSILFERMLDLDCAYGQSGRTTLRAAGPAVMPEAADALRTGKLPRRASLTLESGRDIFSLNFNAESFAIGTLKLPENEEADSARTLFEHRVELLRDLCQILGGLYDTFLTRRAGGQWESHVTRIKSWIAARARKTSAATAEHGNHARQRAQEVAEA